MTAITTPRRPGSGARIAIGGSLGAIAGFVIGAAVAGGLWLWAFAQGLSGVPVRMPGFVVVRASDASTSAEAGPLLLLLPVILAVVLGAVAAAAVALRGGARPPVA